MITLYSTHCPKCVILEKKLKDKDIEYAIVTDVKTMINMGFDKAPMLEVDGMLLEYDEAKKWIDERVK